MSTSKTAFDMIAAERAPSDAIRPPNKPHPPKQDILRPPKQPPISKPTPPWCRR